MIFRNKKENLNSSGFFHCSENEDYSSWIKEEIFHEGDSFFSRMIHDFSEAKDSISLEVYIFELDDLGKEILSVLKKAAERGVKIHLLIDGVGSPDWNESFLKKLYSEKIEARIYHPFSWISFHQKIKSRKKILRYLLIYLSRLNRRNHRKVCIVDEKTAWVGSFNISSRHLKSSDGNKGWRDTGVRVEGAAVSVLLSAFYKTWFRSWGIASCPQERNESGFLKRSKTKLLRLNDSLFLRYRFNQEILLQLRNAKKYIRIINPYFIPTRRLLRALFKSAQRGVEVVVLIPYKSDVRITRWITLVFAKRLLLHGIKVFEYLPRILHAKIMMTDQQATIGSTNLNHRSFIHDLEVEIILLKPSSRLQLEAQFFKDLSHSQELKLSHFQGIRFWQKLLGKIFFLWRYWM